MDNLAKFYFMNELREVAMREDDDDDTKPQPIRRPCVFCGGLWTICCQIL